LLLASITNIGSDTGNNCLTLYAQTPAKSVQYYTASKLYGFQNKASILQEVISFAP
jgi:hypothetical protein